MLIVFLIAVIVFIIGFQQDDAAGFLVAKEGDGFIGGLLQIVDANNVAEGLDRIKNAVGTGKGLQKPMLAQVLRGSSLARKRFVIRSWLEVLVLNYDYFYAFGFFDISFEFCFVLDNA